MPVVVHRQPWFWAVLIALAAVLVFGIAIVAANRDRGADSTTVVQTLPPPPASTETPAAVPVPSGTLTTPAVPVTPAPTPPPVVTAPVTPAPTMPPSGIRTPGTLGTTMPPVTSPPPAAAPGASGTLTQPASPPQKPEKPEKPVQPQAAAKPAPPVVREKTVIVKEKPAVPAKQPAPRETPKDPAAPAEGEVPAPAIPAPGPGTSVREPSTEQFADTGLTREIEYENRIWRAQSVVTITDPDTLVRGIGTARDGALLFVRTEAKEPFDRVLVPVPDQANKYVEYRRR